MSFVLDLLEAEYQKARAHRLYVVNRRAQTPYLVALAAVYGIPRVAGLEAVREQLNLIRDMLLDRTFDMARFEKRFPVTGVIPDEHYCDQDRLLKAFKLCCWCRPPGVIYPPKTQKRRFKSCGHYNYCPACWSRVVEQQYRQYERFAAACFTAAPRGQLVITTHVAEEFVPFPDVNPSEHADAETYSRAVKKLELAVGRVKKRIVRHSKLVQRNSLASLWRIVPVATDRGWFLQHRQFLITAANKKIPVRLYRPSRCVYKQTELITGPTADSATIAFIAFSLYPREHLQDDLDLTSVGLNVMSRQHMLGGTGKFRAAGKALIDAARREPTVSSETHDHASKVAS